MSEQLTVRLLGPFEVAVGGRPVRLTTGRLRALLAALAMSADRLVPVNQLAGAVWGTEPPEDVRRSVTTYVTRLRAVLGGDAIGTGPRGYALRTPPDAVDALRFTRLLDRLQRCADAAEQEALLDTALGLWRGTPFEGVPSPWLATARAPQLVEAFLAATERRIDLDLGRGRYAGLVSRLTELTGRFPLRESLWLRLMVVLDRTGCSAEALARYQRLRVHLADELGVDPQPELRQAHADLLAGRRPRASGLTDPLAADRTASPGSPATDRSARSEAPVARTPPGQLPADLDLFTGRGPALAELDGLLAADTTGALSADTAGGPAADPTRRTARPRVVVVHGPAGVGKTVLAVHWAHRVKHRFPDGQLYVDLRAYDPGRSAMSAEEAMRCLLDSLPDRPEQLPPDLPAQVGLFRSLVAGRRMLLVLDNAHHAGQVRPLLPGTAGCLVLVTSRSEFPGLVVAEGAHPVRLDLLTAAEARELLVRRLGDSRVAAAPQAVDEIIASCAGLPLALAIVAARAATNPGFPLSALSDELRDAPGRLDAFAAGDAATDLRAVFSWSYRTLSPATARLFRQLGLLVAPDITVAAAAALAGVPPRQVRPLLGELARASLVQEHEPGRFTLHDLLGAFAAELASEHDDAGDRTAAVTRVLGFYAGTVWRTMRLLSPGDHRRIALADVRWRDAGLDLVDEPAALEWLGAERGNLLAAVRQAAGTPGVPERIAPQLAHGLFGFFAVRPHWEQWAEVNEIALAVARRLGDRAAEAQATYDLGFNSFLRGRFDEAKTRYEASLAICDDLGDRGGQAACLAGLGDVGRVRGDHDLAIRRYGKSLEIFRSLGDLHGQTLSLGSLGVLHQAQGRAAEALDCLQNSMAIREKLGDRRGTAASLCNLGAFHHREGRYDEALTCYRQSLTIRRQQHDRHGEGTCLAGLGAVHHETGDPVRALRYRRESVTIFRELMDVQCLAENLRPLAATLKALGQADEAEEAEREAAEMFTRLGTPSTDPAAPTAEVRSPRPTPASSRPRRAGPG